MIRLPDESEPAVVVEGDALEVLRDLPNGCVDAIATSPPYAMQRGKQYGGVVELDYPDWTVAWLEAVRPAMSPGASVLLNIREHVRKGQISDYVHRTRLAVRAAGWAEVDELIWHKKNSPPVGHPGRPRRAWERVLWFAPSLPIRCFPKASGVRRCGRIQTGTARTAAQWIRDGQGHKHDGPARCTDVVSTSLSAVPKRNGHPAAFPVDFATWLVRLVSSHGDLIVDPFGGSGTTAVAAIETGRRCLLIEKEPAYCDIARRRIAARQVPA